MIGNIILSQKKELQTEFDSMIKSEIAFSKLSEEQGIKKSFLTYFSDESIVFRPEPVNGKKIYEARNEDSSKLTWKPVYAEISSSGEIGFTTGPWKFSKDTNIAYGHFISIWKKQKDNTWKVIVDAGIPHDAINLETSISNFPDYNSENISSIIIDKPKVKKNLLWIEKEISEQSQKRYSNKTFFNHFDENIRLYRPGYLPMEGKKNCEKFVSQSEEYLIWNTKDAGVSNAGDFGYTYGIGKSIAKDSTEEFSYLNIWRKKNSHWKIVLNLLLPLKSN